MEPQQQVGPTPEELAFIRAAAADMGYKPKQINVKEPEEPFSIGGVPVVPTAINALLTGGGAVASLSFGRPRGDPGPAGQFLRGMEPPAPVFRADP